MANNVFVLAFDHPYQHGETIDFDAALVAGSDCLPLFWLAGCEPSNLKLLPCDVSAMSPAVRPNWVAGIPALVGPVNHMLPLADRRLSSWSEQVRRMDQLAGQWLSFLDKHQGKHLLIHLNEYAEFTSARECHAELGGLLPALDNLNHPAISKFLEGQQAGASTLVKAGPAYSADDLALLVGHSWVSPVPWDK